MTLLWRGFRGGYGRFGNYLRCWHIQRWQSAGRSRLGFGPVVLSWEEPK